MSGYLQRLVQTAAKPAQTVHPFAGSAFAVAHEQESRDVEPENALIANSQKKNAPEYHLAGRPAAAGNDRAIAPGGAATRSEAGPAAVPWSLEKSVHPPRPAAELEVPAANVAVTETEPPAAPASRQREFHPLLLHQEAAAEVAAENLAAHAALRSGTSASPNLRSAAVVRGSDDIQIHIGRIEVTAVAPPAPRAPKSPDRAPNLDAYLNRRTR